MNDLDTPIVKLPPRKSAKKVIPSYDVRSSSFAPLAIVALVFGVLSAIPIIGIFFGVIAVVLGLYARGETSHGAKKGNLMATWSVVLGLFFSVIWLLYYSGMNMGSYVTQKRILNAKNEIAQNVASIEYYRREVGVYPSSLDELREKNYAVILIDPFLRNYAYGLSQDKQAFELVSAGPDRKIDTEDDIKY